MKKLYILIAILGMAFTSCDDFLDIKPVGKVIPTTYQDYRDFLTSAYSSVPYDRSLSTIRGDELILKTGEEAMVYRPIYLWDETNGDGTSVEFPWGQFYKTILNANHVINDGPDATEGTPEELNQLLGEAHLLRAYMHFGLVNLYGDVYSEENKNKSSIPISTKIDIWQNFLPSTIGEVYAHIISDIEAGIKLLNVEQQSAEVRYRFSKVSAYGFASRVYLYMGDYANAKKYAKMAYDINSELIDITGEIHPNPLEYSSVENVLALEQTYDNRLTKGWIFKISGNLTDKYDKNNDYRFKMYFDGEEGSYSFKYGKDLDYKVSMRTAEFYLTLAEAEAKSADGDLNKAKEYIYDLLENRLKSDFFTAEKAAISAMTKAQFIERLKEERARELACQGFRWYDLRRYGKPSITKEYDGKTYTLKQGDIRYVIPFPSEAVANNPNLKQ